jgi:hypothetical protein
MASHIAGTVSGIPRPTDGADPDQEATAIVFREVAGQDDGAGVVAIVPIRDGSFRSPPMAAGEYQVVAVAGFTRVMFGQPERVELLRGQATSVTLGDSETKTVNLSLVTSY